jgi:hypothetical protein
VLYQLSYTHHGGRAASQMPLRPQRGPSYPLLGVLLTTAVPRWGSSPDVRGAFVRAGGPARYPEVRPTTPVGSGSPASRPPPGAPWSTTFRTAMLRACSVDGPGGGTKTASR